METMQRHSAVKNFGEQNAHILNALEKIDICVQNLIRKGFTVHSVEVQETYPVVWIAPEARCVELGGTAQTIRVRDGQQIRVMATALDGCMVQWIGD